MTRISQRPTMPSINVQEYFRASELPTIPSISPNSIYYVYTTNGSWHGRAVTVGHALHLARMAGLSGHLDSIQIVNE